MKDKTYILLTVGIGLLLITSSAYTQEMQWLQYHSEREADRIIGNMPSKDLRLTSERPPNVELPDFQCEEPLFASWSTPMVKSGQLLVALDRTTESERRDQLYIDSNINGHLNDEKPVKAHRTDRYYAYFGPVKVVFEGEDGPLAYHLNFRFYENNNRLRLDAYSGCWYEGDITVGGIKKHCMLIDYNGNGTFNDKSMSYNQCDRIRVGKKGDVDTRFVGNYIEIDDELYHTEIARDGAFIILSKADDVKFGDVQVPETITEFTAGGENGQFTFKPEKGAGSLPVGRYRINSWTIARKDDKGRRWEVEGRAYTPEGDFEVTEEKKISLDVGEPLKANIQASLNSQTQNYEFSKSLRGRMGEYINLTRGGQTVGDLWKMRAKNKEGTFEKTYPMPDQ